MPINHFPSSQLVVTLNLIALKSTSNFLEEGYKCSYSYLIGFLLSTGNRFYLGWFGIFMLPLSGMAIINGASLANKHLLGLIGLTTLQSLSAANCLHL